MAGGHVDAADGLAVAYGVGNDRRGRVAIAEERLESVAREHLGGGQGKFATQKPGVMTQNDNGLAPVEFGVGVRPLQGMLRID